jgi:ribosomal protein S18 acetylase RimI-like enzyme
MTKTFERKAKEFTEDAIMAGMPAPRVRARNQSTPAVIPCAPTVKTEMDAIELLLQRGFPEYYRSNAASLYDEAFGSKFSVAVRSDQKRVSLLEECFMPEYAIVAITDNKLIGIAGFHTPNGSLTGGVTYSRLVSRLGFLKGTWAAVIFSLYERKLASGELLMDGIAVHSDFRGKGIGSKLLDEVAGYASENKYERIRLDVIDTNPEARRLYERKGFKAVKAEGFPYLRWLLGFGSSTTMVLNVGCTVQPKL